MGGCIGGAQNNRCFEENIKNKIIPDVNSINYTGVFSSNYFPIEEINRDDMLSLHLEYSSWTNYDNRNENYIGCLIQTKYDGIGNRKPIDAIFVLDKSGSMGSVLSKSNNNEEKSCISLAKYSIHKLIDILQDDDIFSLITLTESADLVIPACNVKEIKENLTEYKDKISKIEADGGTNLTVGYSLALEEARKIKIKNNNERETRIIFSTDMNDLEESDFITLIKEAADEGIYTTIFGFGVNLNSSFLEKVTKNIGFNYFSALESSDIQKILVDEFDYNFFPVAHKINISLKSTDFNIIDSYGSD